MIRRALIITGIATALLGGLCLLSHVWQYGYISSRGTLGMREGKLWYLWRSTSILDATGLYVDEASAVNRALYNVNKDANWNNKPLWSWVLALPAAVGYIVILVLLRRAWKRPTPRWIVAVLVTLSVAITGAWTASQFVTVEYNSVRVCSHLFNGTLALYTGQLPGGPVTPASTPWARQAGWKFHRLSPSLFMERGAWPRISRRGVILNLPLGLLGFVVLPPTILFARRRKTPPGHCSNCDYDLTGNESGVCPECGTAAAQQTRLPVESTPS